MIGRNLGIEFLGPLAGGRQNRSAAALDGLPQLFLIDGSDDARALAVWLKVRPGEVNYGSSGEGSTGHLAGELFRRATGTAMTHVPYNGGLAGLGGLASGQVSLMFVALPLALPYW